MYGADSCLFSVHACFGTISLSFPIPFTSAPHNPVSIPFHLLSATIKKALSLLSIWYIPVEKDGAEGRTSQIMWSSWAGACWAGGFIPKVTCQKTKRIMFRKLQWKKGCAVIYWGNSRSFTMEVSLHTHGTIDSQGIWQQRLPLLALYKATGTWSIQQSRDSERETSINSFFHGYVIGSMQQGAIWLHKYIRRWDVGTVTKARLMTVPDICGPGKFVRYNVACHLHSWQWLERVRPQQLQLASCLEQRWCLVFHYAVTRKGWVWVIVWKGGLLGFSLIHRLMPHS